MKDIINDLGATVNDSNRQYVIESIKFSYDYWDEFGVNIYTGGGTLGEFSEMLDMMDNDELAVLVYDIHDNDDLYFTPCAN